VAHRPAELHRVYPPLTQRADTEAPHYHATAELEAEIAGPHQVALPVAGNNYRGNWTIPTGRTSTR
jgi:hypothetical protein